MKMNKKHRVTLVVAGLLMSTAAVARPREDGDLDIRTIRGDYLEARTADVYTGPCFANGEVNLAGEEAVLAWRVHEGSWEGVSLDGLTVVAAVKARATLGDPYTNPNPARSVIIVDEDATPKQQEALIDLARAMGEGLLQDVIGVRTAPIVADFGDSPGFARVKAGDVVEVETRALNHHDHICGNEYVYYPPLTNVSHATPAYALAHAYRGKEFNSTWSSPLKRSAFVAEFTR